MRFLSLVATFCILAASLYLVSIYGLASYSEVERLGRIPYFEDVPDGLLFLSLPLTPGRFAVFQTFIWVLLIGSFSANVFLLKDNAYRLELKYLGREFNKSLSALKRRVQRLSASERAVAGTLLLAILLTRLVWFIIDPLSPDETASYDYFVREGTVSVTSFYPIPNNHVLYNFICWVVSELMPENVRVIMRLPSLLVATVGTALSYVLLMHFSNFRIATLVTALFSLVRLTIIYADSGRGYFLQMVCIQLSFFAVVGIVTRHPFRRLAWAMLIGSSIIGLYTIPTYAAPLASLALVLLIAGMQLEPHFRHRFLGQLVLAGVIIAVTTIFCYTPVGIISGWSRLLANRYLASHSLVTFLTGSKAYAYEAASLVGPVQPTLLICTALIIFTPVLLRRTQLKGCGQWMAWASWILILTPAVIMLVQHVFMPGRVIMYTTYFVFLLAALWADQALSQGGTTWTHRLPMAFLTAFIAFRIVELGTQVPTLLQSQKQDAIVAKAYHWLRSQPARRVFVQAPYHAVMFRHYAMLDNQTMALYTKHVSGVHYAYLVCRNDQPLPPAWAAGLNYQAIYQDEMAIIYQLKATL
ncbi:hypothetical protein Q3A66_08575 [Hymenobacter sp. BT770]|uniref:hypothetical protein n=1 Tax=Hymenobacter sp. BT770 TaxID=2886942 RepID=UPI001D0FBC2B|nr:hypothetical protein [Hymenobacter sp. BT770]MCC3152966.1 hypothetical protein [Hymenobacter sp. BT770]MDO3415120.1 hypothetical protein [Hymenobacter sp. BT770]